MWSLLVQVTLAFLAVTLDEFVVLILFFARSFHPEETLLTSQVVLGHIVGFTLVLVLSLAIGCAGLVIPARYLSFLGFIPIGLGIYDLYKRLPRFCGTATSAYGAISSDKMGHSPRSESSTSSSQGEDPEIGFADDTDEENVETDDYSPVTIDEDESLPKKITKQVELRSVGGGGGGEQAHLLTSQPKANYAAVPHSPSSPTAASPSISSVPQLNAPQYQSDDEGYYSVWQRWSLMDPDMLLVIGTALADASEEIAVFAPLFAVMLDYPSVETSLHDGALAWSTIATFGTVMCALYLLLLLELLAAYLVARCALSSASSSSFKWWWDRFVKLGLPLVLIGVGVSVVIDLSA